MITEIDDALYSSSTQLAGLKIWALFADIKERAINWKARVQL